MGDKRIPLTEDTRDRLKQRKRGDDTYEDVILRLLGDGDTDFTATAEIQPTLDEDALDEIAEGVADRVDTDGRDIDYAHLIDEISEGVARRLQG